MLDKEEEVILNMVEATPLESLPILAPNGQETELKTHYL